MNADFEGLLESLSGGGIPFVLVGGYSAMLHGSSLMTRDVDVVCPFDSQTLERLAAQLGPVHPVHRFSPATPALTVDEVRNNRWRNLYLKTDLGVLDCLSEVKGIGDYQACLSRSVPVNLGSFKIRSLSLDALIEAKRAMGRPRDLFTADELELIKEQGRE